VKLCVHCRRRAEGLCRCGAARAKGRTMCRPCAQRHAAHRMASYNRQRAEVLAAKAQEQAQAAIAEQRAREAWL